MTEPAGTAATAGPASEVRKDTQIVLPDFTVVNASAGAGKTHSLAWRVVQILLSERIPGNDFRNILAITFTRNAAAEMKERVLRLLKQIALGEKEALAALAARVQGARDAFPARAERILERILDEFGEFRVQTIDSFLARIFQSSAFEFGRVPGGEIRLDAAEILEEAAAILAQSLAAGGRDRPVFEEVSDILAAERGRDSRILWDPYAHLVDRAAALNETVMKKTAPLVAGNAEAEFRAARERCRAAIGDLVARVDREGWAWASRAEQYYRRALNEGIETVLDLTFPSECLKKGSMKGSYEQASATLAPMLEDVRSALAAFCEARALRRFYPYGALLLRLREEMEEVSRRRQAVSLQDVVHLLHRYIAASAIPSVYLRLGDRVYHYLLDEFQDTAPIQWACLRPLLEETLSKEGSVYVVGDPKQSIYGFRDADWRIMAGLDKHTFESAAFHREELKTNHRSGGHIVAFAREVFQARVPAAGHGREAASSGLSSYRQAPKPGRENDGHVRVTRLTRDDEAQPERERLLAIVDDCLTRGFARGDILILTPANADVIAVGEWLNLAGIPFLSHSSLDIRGRAAVRELLAVLRFLDLPIDDLAFAEVLLGRIFPAVCEREGFAMSETDLRDVLRGGEGRETYAYKRFQAVYPELWDRTFKTLLTVAGYLPVYELLIEIVARFRAFDTCPGDESAIAQLLEAVTTFEQAGLNSLGEFLSLAESYEEGEEWELAAPKEADAVRVMTVHKSKGLSSPVVIALLYDEEREPPVRYHFVETQHGLHGLIFDRRAAELSPILERIRDERRFSATTDRLNALYVTLTRAAEELHVVSISKIYKSENPKPPSMYLPADGATLGEARPKRAAKDMALPPDPLPATLPAGSAEAALPADRVIGHEETRRGEIVHAVLETVEWLVGSAREHAQRGFERVAAGLPDAEDYRSAAGAVERFLESEAGRSVFLPAPETRVCREFEIADETGRLFRIDRLAAGPEQITVIDFKTGGEEPESEYRAQVGRYMRLVASLYPGRSVRGCIAYVDRCALTEVEP